MKNKKVYICMLIIIILISLFIIGIKLGEKFGNNEKQSNKKNIGIEDRLYESPDNFSEEYAEIKGRYNSNIKGKDYFYITNTVFIDEIGLELEEYSEFIVNITSDSKIIDYNNLTDMKFDDIKQNDVIFYNGIIKKAKGVASAIEVGENKIYVLKNSDIKDLAIRDYSGKKELKNVCISYVDEKHILAQIKVNTNKNDGVLYLTYLKLSNDVEVDKYCRNRYADIVMNEPFNDFSEGENEVIKINFK